MNEHFNHVSLMIQDFGDLWDLTKDDRAALRHVLEEVERLRAEIKQIHKDYGCEVRDPCGTIWDHAANLQKELEQVKAELAQLRKDWCDDDEAIKQQALRVLPKFEVEVDSVQVPRMGELAEMMADTALRYKEEGLAWMMAAQDKECELAAAKAASVVPKIEAGYRMAYTLGTNSILIECDFSWDAKVIAEWVQRIKKHGA